MSDKIIWRRPEHDPIIKRLKSKWEPFEPHFEDFLESRRRKIKKTIRGAIKKRMEAFTLYITEGTHHAYAKKHGVSYQRARAQVKHFERDLELLRPEFEVWMEGRTQM